jgi:hypothetical protein
MRYRATQNATFVLLLFLATVAFFWVIWEFVKWLVPPSRQS